MAYIPPCFYLHNISAFETSHFNALWQEEEEADYKQRYPDYHASFADILEDGMEMDEQTSMGHQDQQQQGATQAEASSASSKQLMQGQLLDDIVVQHARYAYLTLGGTLHLRALCPFSS